MYLCKHADILQQTPLFDGQSGYIVIFRIIKVRILCSVYLLVSAVRNRKQHFSQKYNFCICLCAYMCILKGSFSEINTVFHLVLQVNAVAAMIG